MYSSVIKYLRRCFAREEVKRDANATTMSRKFSVNLFLQTKKLSFVKPFLSLVPTNDIILNG